MQLSYLYGAFVFALSLLVPPTTAFECEVGNFSADIPLIVFSSDELSAAVPADCTVLIGSITIAQNFTGLFSLNDISNFTGSISSPGAFDGSGESVPDLLGFEMASLTTFGQGQYYSYGGIFLNGASKLQSMSIPHAPFIPSIQVIGFFEASFEFHSLVSSGTIEITGGEISSIFLPSLATVEYLQISSHSGPFVPQLDLELPALTNASDISITANLSRVSMPLLSLVTGGEMSTSATAYNAFGGLSITNLDDSGSSVAMIFPQLQTINNTKFSGAIETIYLPSLTNTQGDIYVTASKPLAVNLTNLESAHVILLTGNISSVDFPALTYVDNINVESQIYCNCTPVYTAYNTTWKLHSLNNNSSPMVSCFSPPTSESNKSDDRSLSTNAKTGIVLGIAMPSVAVIAFLYFWFLNRKSKHGVKDRVAEGARVELDEMDLRDPPPAYDSVMEAATEVGSLRSERTAVEPLEAGDNVQHELGDVHRETAAVGDGDVSPMTPVERDRTRQ